LCHLLPPDSQDADRYTFTSWGLEIARPVARGRFRVAFPGVGVTYAQGPSSTEKTKRRQGLGVRVDVSSWRDTEVEFEKENLREAPGLLAEALSGFTSQVYRENVRAGSVTGIRTCPEA
jgi:hypothetical protein